MSKYSVQKCERTLITQTLKYFKYLNVIYLNHLSNHRYYTATYSTA